MLRRIFSLGMTALPLFALPVGAPLGPPKPVAKLREPTSFERFCSSLGCREELTLLGSDLFPGEHTGLPDDYFKYSRLTRHIQVGQTSFSLVFERKPQRRMWTYTPPEGPQENAAFPAYLNRIGFKDDKGDLQVLLTTYSDFLPKELEPALISLPVPMTRAVYGHDDDPFEKPGDFKVGFQEDALVWVYEGMEPQGLQREFPLGVDPMHPIIKGRSLATHLALGTLKEKPIAFSRKMNARGVLLDAVSASQVPAREPRAEATRLWKESRQDPAILSWSSIVPPSRGLSLRRFSQAFQVGAQATNGLVAPLKTEQTGILDLPVREPLMPWDQVFAGEHGDGERFILLDFDDPFDTYSKVYLAFYENEPFPRIALSHRDVVGVTGGRSLSSAQWYRVRADIEQPALDHWRDPDGPNSRVMQLLREVDKGVGPVDRCLKPLRGGGLDRAREILEPRDEPKKRSLPRIWVLPNAINALRVPVPG